MDNEETPACVVCTMCYVLYMRHLLDQRALTEIAAKCWLTLKPVSCFSFTGIYIHKTKL